MIIKFWDKTQIIVTKQQWENIKKLRTQGKTWIELKNPNLEFDPKTIAQVLSGGITEVDISETVEGQKLLKNPTPASIETRERVRQQLIKKGIIRG